MTADGDPGVAAVPIPQTICAPPDFPCERGIFLSNLWYGHQQAIVRHMGLDPKLVALPGKLQNGWQPGTGLDGEQGMKMEVTRDRLPFYLWSSRAMRHARAEGLDWGRVIGAPFLYAFPAPVRVSGGVGLVAFPTHSVEREWRVAGWRAYASDLAMWAWAEGISPVRACLYHIDYACDEIRQAFAAANVEVVTLGDPFGEGYLGRFAELVRAHEIVTSERVCSAGMYALWLHRPFWIRGRPLDATHPELDIGPAGDPSYLRREFPELLRHGHDVQRDTAARELGRDHVRSPDALIDVVFRGIA